MAKQGTKAPIETRGWSPFLEFKFDVKATEVVGNLGKFKGYASTRKKDSYNDIVAPGAFTRTIDHNEGKVPILWFHTPWEPVGMSEMMSEDGHGLYTEGWVDLDVQEGQRVWSGMQKGYIDRMSIGYSAVDWEYDAQKDVRILKEVRLFEYSLITRNFSANDEALITGFKNGRFPAMLNDVAGLSGLTGASPEDVKAAINALQALLTKSGSGNPTPPVQDAPKHSQDSAVATLAGWMQELKAGSGAKDGLEGLLSKMTDYSAARTR